MQPSIKQEGPKVKPEKKDVKVGSSKDVKVGCK